MKKAWRWNNEASKRSAFNSILDTVVRDLFAGRDRHRRRPSGATRPHTKPRRQSFTLETIEPRLLLSADISYVPSLGNPLVHDFTLKAESGNVLNLYETGTSTVAGTATLSSAGDTNFTLERSGGAVVQGAFADTIHVNLDSFSNLNSFVESNGNLLTINFTGGDQTLSRTTSASTAPPPRLASA